jgi:hypothetical protein
MSALYASTSVAPEVTCEERSVTRRRAAADIARDSVRRGREGLEREERDANSRRFGDTRARARVVCGRLASRRRNPSERCDGNLDTGFSRCFRRAVGGGSSGEPGEDLPYSGRRAPASCATRGTRYAARLACSVPQPPRSALRRPRRARPRPVRDARTSSARRPLLSARIVARTSLPDASRGRAWAAPREATARAWGGTTSVPPPPPLCGSCGRRFCECEHAVPVEPPYPGPEDCCQSSPQCKFCVWTTYASQLEAYEARLKLVRETKDTA